MQEYSDDNLSDVKIVNFGSIPVDASAEKTIFIQNACNRTITFRVSSLYSLNSVDRAFDLNFTSTTVPASENAELIITYKPKIPGQSLTEYYFIDDTAGNSYRLTVTGKCFGPQVSLNKNKLVFRICKNVNEQRMEMINIVNNSSIDATYQWLLPLCGQGYFQIPTGNCGVIRAHETIRTNILFTGTALGVYSAELICLVLNQEPLFINMIATVVFSGNAMFNVHDHIFQTSFKQKSRCTHLMENSLNQLPYIPSASVFERYLDFDMGSVTDNTLNISQTLCVTNHKDEDGYIQWMQDPDNVFLIDPIASIIPPNESRLFTVRFRPIKENEVYGYLMCGDYQQKIVDDGTRLKHTWFRVPCIGHTWSPCTEWTTEWSCPNEIILPPTVPGRTTFGNFMLSNKLDIPMHFKFQAPSESNFVIMPMCGIVQSRGWEIITAALEPNTFGDYYENWDLIINKVETVRIRLAGNAEISQIELMSHGYNPSTHAMYEFPPTITGCTNSCSAYLHNMTRMTTHIRVLNSAPWLGADDGGSILLKPKEIIKYDWWFFPTVPNKVYETTVVLSCVNLINNKPVGEPRDLFVQLSGFSEYPNLKILPNKTNLNDIVVGENASVTVCLYNYGSCFFTSKLYSEINGMGDDYSGDRLEIESSINSLEPSNHCSVKFTVTPNGAGSRQLDIKYTVLYRNEYDEIQETQPITAKICTVWYDGIYPTIKIKRTISVKCPVILSNHCVWNIVNVEALNKALMDCRPNKPLTVDLHAPDLCLHAGQVELIFVMGTVYNVPVVWNLRREKICDCDMVEVQLGISTYELRHNCKHREMIEIKPLNGIVSAENPGLLYLNLNYISQGNNTLCYIMSLPNQRTLYINFNIYAHLMSRGILTPLRRPKLDGYLAVLDCGRVPINNLDSVIRIAWLYNPTDVFTTWRLLKGNSVAPDSVTRCLLYFAEVPPLGKLAIPFAFMPTEMIHYEVSFQCSFGYEIVKILVTGQGGLPNCVETRLDIPTYIERVIRMAYSTNVVYLSKEHFTLPLLPTHSLYREIVAVCNDTENVMRFIWLPERIANIVNVVMTPCWGVLQPKSVEWITMTIYTLQEPATFTTTVACEVLDLTARRQYQRNELLRRTKADKCQQEFVITEHDTFHPGINDCPPLVLSLEPPAPRYLALTVAVAAAGQRDGCPRMTHRQIWEKTPAYDLLSSDEFAGGERGTSNNNLNMADIIRIIDGLLWDALHSKMMKHQLQYYAKEEIPSYQQLMNVLATTTKPRLSRRVTSGICDAIVNKAVYHVYGLNPKEEISILDV